MRITISSYLIFKKGEPIKQQQNIRFSNQIKKSGAFNLYKPNIEEVSNIF